MPAATVNHVNTRLSQAPLLALYTLCQKSLILHLHPISQFQFHFRIIRHLEILSRAAWLLLLPFMPLACLGKKEKEKKRKEKKEKTLHLLAPI